MANRRGSKRVQRFAVIGLGRFGQRLARVLAEGGSDVIAIDRQNKPVEELRDVVSLAVKLDSTNEEALRSQGVHEVDAAVVAIGEGFENAVLSVAVLKAIGVPRILARADEGVHAEIMTRIGADQIINPEQESGGRWAQRLSLPNLQKHIDLGESHAMVYVEAPRSFHGKTPVQLQLRQEHGLNLVAIQRVISVEGAEDSRGQASTVVAVPDAKSIIQEDDVLILVGSHEAIAALPAC